MSGSALARRGAQPPSLLKLRAGRAPASGQGVRSSSGLPTPGGIGVGTVYTSNQLQALAQGELYTRMLVHPDGVRPTTGGLDWLFSTATNRVEQGVEVVAIYARFDPNRGDFGIFDWSCAPDFPCEGGITSASWIWTRPLSDFACNMDLADVGEGRLHRTVYYVNASRKLDGQKPPLWRNEVLLWNYCHRGWDLVYRHDYRKEQQDCSVTGACAWWGPILETFASTTGEAPPAIRELGFDNARLLHDGAWSLLPPGETDFVTPHAPWRLYRLTPNRTFNAGNSLTHKIGFEVRPGVSSPCVDPARWTEVRAAVLSGPSFSASRVDAATLRIGRAGASALRPRLADVNRDGRPDLVFAFRGAASGLVRGDTRLWLVGRTKAGLDVGGIDAIRAGTCG